MIEGTSIKDVETITIPMEEYKRLLETHTRVEVFKAFVNKEKYNIDRQECGVFLGFEVANGES